MAFTPDAHYEQGHWYLIPQPLAAVKADLESRLSGHGLRGFLWHDDSAPLATMEFYWTQISLQSNPDLQRTLSQQRARTALPVLDQALAAGAITSAERGGFARAIENQTEYGKETLAGHPFFSQRIARWSFYRKSGGTKKFDEMEGILLDVSPMLARKPMTLVWFNGWKTVKRSEFRATTEMTGVAVIPSPHFQHWSDVTENPDPRVVERIAATARSLQALSDENSEQVMRGYFTAYNSEAASAASPEPVQPPASEALPPGTDLPTDEGRIRHYQNQEWRMVGLPDGSMLLSGDQTHRFLRQGTQVHRENAIPELAHVQTMKVDALGRVWGYFESDSENRQFVLWDPQSRTSESYPFPSNVADSLRGYEWTLLPDSTPAFMDHSAHCYSLDPQGKWVTQVWNNDLRHAVMEALDHAIPQPDNPDRTVPHFADGLFWQTDRDLYGIDPKSARVGNALRTSSASIVFGSHESRWGLILDKSAKGGVARIIDLTTQQTRLAVTTSLVYYTSALARSAQGRLLAVSAEFNNSVLVLDLQQNKPLAQLLLPSDSTVEALAFSWKGDQLWLYASGTSGSPARMFVWDLPSDTADPAQHSHMPDQLRYSDRRNRWE